MKKRVEYACARCKFAGDVWIYQFYHTHSSPNRCRCKRGPRYGWTRPYCPACDAEAQAASYLEKAKELRRRAKELRA